MKPGRKKIAEENKVERIVIYIPPDLMDIIRAYTPERQNYDKKVDTPQKFAVYAIKSFLEIINKYPALHREFMSSRPPLLSVSTESTQDEKTRAIAIESAKRIKEHMAKKTQNNKQTTNKPDTK